LEVQFNIAGKGFGHVMGKTNRLVTAPDKLRTSTLTVCEGRNGMTQTLRRMSSPTLKKGGDQCGKERKRKGKEKSFKKPLQKNELPVVKKPPPMLSTQQCERRGRRGGKIIGLF